MRRVIAAVAAVGAVSSTAFAADYFVAAGGLDTATGTSPSAAWRSITQVNATSFKPGDRVLFEGGTTFRGQLRFEADDAGTAEQPITVSSYGATPATIAPDNGDGLTIHNTAGFVVSRLTIAGSGRTNNTNDGILLLADDDGDVKHAFVRIAEVDVSGFGAYGLEMRGAGGRSGFRDVRISHSQFHENARAGIASAGDRRYAHENVVVEHCRVHHNTGIPGLPRNSGNGIVLAGVDGALIERSVAYENGSQNTANGGPIGIWTYDSTHVTIQFNESYANRTNSESDGGGFGLDGGVTSSVMQYNYAHDNEGAGYMLAQYPSAARFSGNVVRYNISQNDGRKNGYSGIDIYNGGSGISNVDIFNNTVFITPSTSRSSQALRVARSTTNVHVRNNLFIAAGGADVIDIDIDSDQVDLTLQGNAYWSVGRPLTIRWGAKSFHSLDEWRQATGQEQVAGRNTGLTVDPKISAPGGAPLLDDADKLETLAAYRLTRESPLVDAGLDLREAFGIDPGMRDFFGTLIPRRNGFDIGASEHSEPEPGPPR